MPAIGWAALLVALLLPNWAWGSDLDRLPDHRVAKATGDIIRAWLIGPTKRYQHFVLGSRYEAAGVRVETNAGVIQDLILPDNAVFEDREPRLADLDGDGRNEVVLVKSTAVVGSSLALIGLRDGKLQLLAETPPNGRSNRWLNPAGFGRFTMGNRLQVAIVRMPHVLGGLGILGLRWRQAEPQAQP